MFLFQWCVAMLDYHCETRLTMTSAHRLGRLRNLRQFHGKKCSCQPPETVILGDGPSYQNPWNNTWAKPLEIGIPDVVNDFSN